MRSVGAPSDWARSSAPDHRTDSTAVAAPVPSPDVGPGFRTRTATQPMPQTRLRAAIACGALAIVPACSRGGAAGDPANRGDFAVTLISTGSGQIHPARVRRLDDLGNPTDTVLNIENLDTLHAHATTENPILPTATFAPAALLPHGAPGNHFFLVRFSHDLAVESILSDDIANSTNSGLTTAVALLAYDPLTEATAVLKGRGFVGGVTFARRGERLVPVRAVARAGDDVQVLTAEGEGFPRGFTNAADLVAPNAFVFVADADGDLRTFETVPRDRLLRVAIDRAVLDSERHVLEAPVCTATTVGADPAPPDVLGFATGAALGITPQDGATDVDPRTGIVLRFNKPVQPADVGAYYEERDLTPPTRGVSISVQRGADVYPMLYYAEPFGAGDLCNYLVRPAWQLPGGGEFSIRVAVQGSRVRGVADASQTLGNDALVTFTTGDGPGIVNAPVAPEAIYIGMGGAEPGVAVIDLNGFGQGSGDPALSRWDLNPNIGQVDVDPPLSADPARGAVTGGSAGVFTLTQDSRGRTRLLDRALVGAVGDLQLGAPLDLVFNNEARNRLATRSNQVNPITQVVAPGNNIPTPPHPNPPKLDLANPQAPERGIFGERPTRTSAFGTTANVVVTSPPCARSPRNLLVAGNPFARERSQVGVFGGAVQGVFNGPQPIPPSPPVATPYCPFTSRQQIGHFLYVLDRDNRQVLVVNSNRFTVLDTIKFTDPTDMAVAPNLRRLAVSNFSSSTVTILDIDPTSPRFHQVVAESRVARGPTAIVWQPDGEDLLVVSPGANAVTILGGLDFQARRELGGFLNAPIDVVATQRFAITGNASGVYYAYILNGNGTVAVYESGPDGTNGWGFNDVVGLVQGVTFPRATKLLHDIAAPLSGVFVAHVDERGVGQVSRLGLTATPTGTQPTQQNQGGNLLPPTFRQKVWSVTQRFGGGNATTPVRDQLSGNAPIDLALDEIYNFGAVADQTTAFNQGVQPPPTGHSGKGVVKAGQPAFSPKFLFVALADTGRVDVFQVDSGQRLATIVTPGVLAVASYWRN